MEVKIITEGMTAPQVAQVIDDNFKGLNEEKANKVETDEKLSELGSKLVSCLDLLESVDVCLDDLERMDIETSNVILTNKGITSGGYNDYSTSEYIEIDLNKIYYFKPNRSMSESFSHIAFYGKSQEFLFSVLGNIIPSDKQQLFKIMMPTGAYYFRVCGQKDNVLLYNTVKKESIDGIIANKVLSDVLVGGINLFDKNNIIGGKSFDKGLVVDKANFFVSDYINISKYSRLSVKTINAESDLYVLYDKNKNVIEYGYSKDVNNKITNGAYYVRISSYDYTSYLTKIMVCAGHLPSVYVPYNMVDKTTRYDIKSTQYWEQLDMPLLNAAQIIDTTYTNGIFGSSHAGFETSDYIPTNTDGFVLYYYTTSTYSAGLSKIKFYDKDFVEIGSINGAALSDYKNMLVKLNPPKGCEYIKYARASGNNKDGVCTIPYMSFEEAVNAVLTPKSKETVLWLGTSIPEGATYPLVSCNNNGYDCINNALGQSRLRFTGTPTSVGVGSGRELTARVDELKSIYQSHVGNEISQTEFNNWLDKSYERSVLPYIKGESLVITDGTTNAVDGVINPNKVKVSAVVIDHGYNDYSNVNTIMENQSLIDWDSTDRSVFVGAFNYLVNEIQKINPFIKIIIGGYFDYTFISSGKPLGKNLCDLHKLLSEHYNFELLNVWDYTQISWDRFVQGTSEYMDDFNAKYGTSYSVPSYGIDSNGNIRSHFLYCPDGIHPHSDKTGNTNKRLDAVYTKLLRSIL